MPRKSGAYPIADFSPSAQRIAFARRDYFSTALAGRALEVKDVIFYFLGIAALQVALFLLSRMDLREVERTIMANEADVLAALNKIDAATTQIAGSLQTQVGVVQTISDEMDALETALKNAGVSQSLVDQASALGDKAQAASDALSAQIPVLQAIASKGAANPVPVPVPTP